MSQGQPDEVVDQKRPFCIETGECKFFHYLSHDDVTYTHTRMRTQEIDANPNIVLVFYWNALNRSVRIEGKAERIPASESEDYFR